METIFLKIKIKKSDKETDKLREEGLLFSNIAEAIHVDRNEIEEVDEQNYLKIIKEIQKKFSKIGNQ